MVTYGQIIGKLDQWLSLSRRYASPIIDPLHILPAGTNDNSGFQNMGVKGAGGGSVYLRAAVFEDRLTSAMIQRIVGEEHWCAEVRRSDSFLTLEKRHYASSATGLGTLPSIRVRYPLYNGSAAGSLPDQITIIGKRSEYKGITIGIREVAGRITASVHPASQFHKIDSVITATVVRRARVFELLLTGPGVDELLEVGKHEASVFFTGRPSGGTSTLKAAVTGLHLRVPEMRYCLDFGKRVMQGLVSAPRSYAIAGAVLAFGITMSQA